MKTTWLGSAALTDNDGVKALLSLLCDTVLTAAGPVIVLAAPVPSHSELNEPPRSGVGRPPFGPMPLVAETVTESRKDAALLNPSGTVECAPGGGQFQAAVLTGSGAW